MDLFLLTVSQNYVSAQPTQCGTVGHNLQSQQNKLTIFQFYLNTQYPAPCSGNVATWRYCYYSPDVTARDYMATFGVYRLTGSDYVLVSEIFSISVGDIGSSSESFTCQTFTTPSDSVTTIQQGDVVGACVLDVRISNDREAHLNLVGNNATGYSMQFADTSNNRCNSGNAVSVPKSVSQDALSSLNSTVLHLYANIGEHKMYIHTCQEITCMV